MAHTVIHKNYLLEDCDYILFLILTEPANARSLVPLTDPRVCVIITNIAWNIMSLY